MVSQPAALSQETFDWFLAGDERAYAQLTEFLLRRARSFGAGAEAEDLAQSLLLDLLTRRERGALPIHSVPELEAYLTVSIQRRYISFLRKPRSKAGDDGIDDVPAAMSAPDAPLRALEYVELCINLMRHALERAGAAASTWQVMERIFDRFVRGKDVERVLLERGLLEASATLERRSVERETENRRQSRARTKLLDALHALGESTRTSNVPASFRIDSRQVPFDAQDVESALRFALALGRSERSESPTRMGHP